jgi:hypothetical protein
MPASPTIRAGLSALVVLLTAGLASCSDTPTSPTPEASPPTRESPLPRRPVNLHVDQVDMCSLLSQAERANLKIDEFGSNDNNTAVCSWSVGRGAQSYGWLAKFDVPKRFEQAARGPGARLTSVGGFPAAQTSPARFDPTYGCTYVVDIAPDQDFTVGYLNDNKDIPGMTHEKACQQALSVAELTMANLKAKAR